MGRTRVSAGMWRIDPKKPSRVIDRCGRSVATVENGSEPSLIATAPDMYDLLENIEHEGGDLSAALVDRIRLVLRRARGEFGSAVFSSLPGQRRFRNQDWLRFMDSILKPPPGGKE